MMGAYFGVPECSFLHRREDEGHARTYVWWPGIDVEIEKSVRTCVSCQEVQSSPPVAPLNPWKWPSMPWARLHLDFAGPFENKMFSF